jgi:hypothetical protein
MIELAGTSRAVVPALAAGPLAACPLAAERAGAPRPAAGAAAAIPDDAPLELAELPEHPASVPPASTAPPIARPATPNRVRLVRAGRRFMLRLFTMAV